MWKIIKQEAQVADAYKDSFYKGFKDIIGARYPKERGSSLMNMITEANPNFDPALFGRLMSAIEGQRTNFLRNQKLLQDLQIEHKTLLERLPSSLVVGHRQPVEITIVTSTVADDAFRTKHDDDVGVFAK